MDAQASTGSPSLRMGRIEWVLLLGLSVLWGASFIFTEVALRALPPLSVVFVRVGLGAATLLLIMRLKSERLPPGAGIWAQLFVLSTINNVIPFSLIVWGQTQITAGLASILNGTTPIFAVVVAHMMSRDEPMTRNRALGVVLGLAGVAVLIGPGASTGDSSWLGQFAVLGAACSYGFAVSYARRLSALKPLSLATGQLVASTALMLPIVAIMDQPWGIDMPGVDVIAALIALAVFSTALAYIMFFRIIAGAGATNAALVTLLIPVSTIAMGYSILGEPLVLRQVLGAAVIGFALIVIDGRFFPSRS